ncbi:hypothetical protein C9I99_19200 [Photobacterium lutimaris]|uniref:Uncharacterized protein n=1 Tax=Photobacterium lutimaris TaxID=388278 RepID=A0A2T3IV71_9GAMM|nr:hypothetical protein C9I99_19200 [Photobacterium lutimaris]
MPFFYYFLANDENNFFLNIKLAIGYWLLAIGYWLLAIGYWLKYIYLSIFNTNHLTTSIKRQDKHSLFYGG